jgi:hypothetical protein
MSLRCRKICNNRKTFKCFFGINLQEFEVIVKKIEPRWHERVISAYKRLGFDYKLDLSDAQKGARNLTIPARKNVTH